MTRSAAVNVPQLKPTEINGIVVTDVLLEKRGQKGDGGNLTYRARLRPELVCWTAKILKAPFFAGSELNTFSLATPALASECVEFCHFLSASAGSGWWGMFCVLIVLAALFHHRFGSCPLPGSHMY